MKTLFKLQVNLFNALMYKLNTISDRLDKIENKLGDKHYSFNSLIILKIKK